MALRAGYYGIKRGLKAKLAEIAGAWDETVSSIFPRDEQAILGAVNIMPNNAKYQSGSGVTYTVNADGTVTITGTASAVTQLSNRFVANEDYTGVYLSGIPAKGLGCYMTLTDVTASTDIATDIGEGTNAFNLVKGHQYNCKLISGATAVFTNPVTVSPMISLVKGQAYVPYAMTNRELTESVQTDETTLSDHKTEINAIISAATGAADFAAFKTAMEALTPLTRTAPAPASDTRSIPEEDPVEEPVEEPVTKKRTTKKTTVKEGE